MITSQIVTAPKRTFRIPGDYSYQNLILGPGGKAPNEWRDLFVHDALSSAGIRVKARPKKALGISGKELQGVSNPDIEIDGMMWEIKSPYDIGKEQSACELRVINNALKDSERNFRNPYDYIKRCGSGNLTIGRRVILNERYKRMDADRLASEDEKIGRASCRERV